MECPEPATVEQMDFKFPIDRVATLDTTIGATCNLLTTANSIYPGSVLEDKRNIWQLGGVIVKDAGPNGTGYANCRPTCGDGDESNVPASGTLGAVEAAVDAFLPRAPATGLPAADCEVLRDRAGQRMFELTGGGS